MRAKGGLAANGRYVWRLGFDVRGLKVTTGASKKRQLEPCVELNDSVWCSMYSSRCVWAFFLPSTPEMPNPARSEVTPGCDGCTAWRCGDTEIKQTSRNPVCLPSPCYTPSRSRFIPRRDPRPKKRRLWAANIVSAGCVVASFGY